MALIGGPTADISSDTSTCNVSRKRRKSSLGVKLLTDLSREFSTSFGSCSDSVVVPQTTNSSLDNHHRYTTVISSLYSSATVSTVSVAATNKAAVNSSTALTKFNDRGSGSNVLMKIQFQITTAPDLDGVLPPTPTTTTPTTTTTTTTTTTGLDTNPPLLSKHRSNSAMVPASAASNAASTQVAASAASHVDEATASRRHQLQILHQQKLDMSVSDNATDDQQQVTTNNQFKREHRRRPSTTIGVNLDSKGSVTNHHFIVAQSQSEDNSSSLQQKHQPMLAALQTTRSATFGSFSGTGTGSGSGSASGSGSGDSSLCSKESIYFKRDGQRFSHEFTLKLSVDRTYRCLLKIKPSIPLQSISIQGHHIRFHDCTQTSQQQQQQHQSKAFKKFVTSETTSMINSSHQSPISPIHHLTRHFLHTQSHTHNSGQLIYVFDWSASRFEVNKNKARTEVQMVLKFKNGQTLVLPLQVKFYYSDCRQHLNWGSLLHFIDYDCLVNKLGNISVNRVQFY